MPPAFVLSQDQTLRLSSTQSNPERPNQASHQQEQIHRIQLAYPSSQHPQLPRSARNQDAQSDAQIGSYARTLSGPSVPSKTSQTAACASLPFHNVQEPRTSSPEGFQSVAVTRCVSARRGLYEAPDFMSNPFFEVFWSSVGSAVCASIVPARGESSGRTRLICLFRKQLKPHGIVRFP
jgi:hypothetical protein